MRRGDAVGEGLDWSRRRGDETVQAFRDRMRAEAEGGTVDRGVFAGRGKVGEREVVEWVFENMDVEGLVAGDAPSAGAWALLKECRSSRSVRELFYMNVWVKLLPTRGSVDEAAERRRAEGVALEHVERVLAAAGLARGIAGAGVGVGVEN